MFGGKGGSKAHNNIECLIGAGATVEGNIIFSGGLRVDGRVRGDVLSAEGKPGTRKGRFGKQSRTRFGGRR